MDSRLLASLNAQAEGTRDPVVWAKAVCRAASHFARHGRTEEALKSIGVVRAQFGKELHYEIASWLMLAEGVLHYFQGQPREAYDRVRRAHGLAVALENASARPTCAAWMAMLEVESCSYEKVADHLSEALTLAAADDHQARCRAAMVLANGLHLAGRYELARPWYELARQSATAEEDRGAISAMLYNVAAIRAANVRLDAVFGKEAAAEAHRARMESASSTNYDAAIGVTSLEHLSKLLQGLLLTLEGKFSEALEVFESIDISAVLPRMQPPMLIDQAWCFLNLGRSTDAWQLAKTSASMADSIKDFDDDDMAYFAGRMALIADRCDQHLDAAAYKAKSLAALSKHQSFQEYLLGLMQPISDSASRLLTKKNPA